MTETTVNNIVETTEAGPQVTVSDFIVSNLSDIIETKALHFKQFKAPIIIKSLTAEEFEAVKKGSTIKVRSKSGQLTQQRNEDKLTDLMIEKSVTQPNLKDASLQEHYGTIGDPAATLRAMLTAGQYAEIQVEISRLSGFDDEDVELIEDQVKN